MADLLIPFVAGQKDTADAHNIAHDLRREKYQSATQSSANTTFVSSTDLVFDVEANTAFVFESQLFVDTNTTADVKFNLLLPASATVRIADGGGNSTTSTQRVYAGVGAGTVISCNPNGFIDIAGTAGTLTIQFAQNATSGSTILQVGSWVRLCRVA